METAEPIIYDWSRLHRDCADIPETVMDNWKKLLNSEKTEPAYQSFLAEHAGFFFGEHGYRPVVISQLQLGTARKPDFVAVHDMRGGGAHFEFIELKRPDDGCFTGKGERTAALNKALQQVGQLAARIADNDKEILDRMPSASAASRSCSYSIFIGRREKSREWLRERNELASQSRIWIHSYD